MNKEIFEDTNFLEKKAREFKLILDLFEPLKKALFQSLENKEYKLVQNTVTKGIAIMKETGEDEMIIPIENFINLLGFVIGNEISSCFPDSPQFLEGDAKKEKERMKKELGKETVEKIEKNFKKMVLGEEETNKYMN